MADRRTFLRGLASLPLLGGSVAIIGSHTAAAVPVTPDLLRNYDSWLQLERTKVLRELYAISLPRKTEALIVHLDEPAFRWHWPCEGDLPPAPSTRAAIVLSAVGCPLTGDAA